MSGLGFRIHRRDCPAEGFARFLELGFNFGLRGLGSRLQVDFSSNKVGGHDRIRVNEYSCSLQEMRFRRVDFSPLLRGFKNFRA